MTLQQLIELLTAMKTADNQDMPVVLFTNVEIAASTVIDDGECITLI